jgi:hypothetical protein
MAVKMSLNPQSFPSSLTFEWFASDEGLTWQAALSRLLGELALDELEQVFVENLVGLTLGRIGKEKFRRHFEIRPISIGQEHSMVELRWLLNQSTGALHLRLYAYLDHEAGRLIGLFFRQKVIGSTTTDTQQSQNQDIFRAIELAIQHKAEEKGSNL